MKRKFNPIVNQLKVYVTPLTMGGSVTISQDFLGKVLKELKDLYDEHEILMKSVIATGEAEGFWFGGQEQQLDEMINRRYELTEP